MPRLFVALPVPEPLAAALAAVRAEAEGVRWTPPEQLHLTLAFLGDVAPEAGGVVAEPLGAITADPVPLALGRLAVFPNRRRPRVLVATLHADPALLDLHRKVLAGIGLAPEARPFRPHVTLARLREPAPEVLAAVLRPSLPPLAATAEEFRLVESVLHPNGARHTTRARYPLGRTRSG